MPVDCGDCGGKGTIVRVEDIHPVLVPVLDVVPQSVGVGDLVDCSGNVESITKPLDLSGVELTELQERLDSDTNVSADVVKPLQSFEAKMQREAQQMQGAQVKKQMGRPKRK
jgi:hypothetical protein